MSAPLVVPVAGLQYYHYRRDDGMGGRAEPRAGDPITLVHEPGNRHDRFAIEVWWRNGVKLGHLPRDTARDFAPLIDAGVGLVARVSDPGRGCTWSMTVALSGPAVERLEADELETDLPESMPWPADEDLPF